MFAPHGRLAIVNPESFVAVQTLVADPHHARAAACAQSGRNLTRGEWNRYVRSLPYERTCSRWP